MTYRSTESSHWASLLDCQSCEDTIWQTGQAWLCGVFKLRSQEPAPDDHHMWTVSCPTLSVSMYEAVPHHAWLQSRMLGELSQTYVKFSALYFCVCAKNCHICSLFIPASCCRLSCVVTVLFRYQLSTKSSKIVIRLYSFTLCLGQTKIVRSTQKQTTPFCSKFYSDHFFVFLHFLSIFNGSKVTKR